MPIHVFVDETKSRGLLMAAARCPAGDLNVNRKALRALLLPGQERLHFNNESDARRKKILATISAFQLLVDLYQTQRNDVGARQRCLEAIVRDIAPDAERLVIERDEGALDYDRRAMHEACHRYGCIELRRELLVAKADPLLWIPDAVAWAWMKGGDWRRRVSPYCQLRPIENARPGSPTVR
jgi:hypothetical protein